MILLIGAAQIFHAQGRQYVLGELPAGWAAVNPDNYQKLHWIEEHTHPEDWFFQASWPGVYFPLQLRNPVFEDVVGLNIDTHPEFLQRSIAQLEEKKCDIYSGHNCLIPPEMWILQKARCRRSGPICIGIIKK